MQNLPTPQPDVFQQRVQNYTQPKPADDIDLVAEVRSCLVSAGLTPLLADAYDSNRFVIEAKDKEATVQRYLLNRYWGQQLMSSNKPTTEERYALIPNGEVTSWLELFKAKILPFAIENNLPRVLSNG